MLFNLAIAAAMILLTTAIHAASMVACVNITRRLAKPHQSGSWSKVATVAVVIMVMSLASLAEAAAWAAIFTLLNAVADFEEAMYFSAVTYTTLGYGDVVIENRWRILAAIEAVNGIIMFGWTTAIIVAVIHGIYFNDDEPNTAPASK